LYNGGTLTVTGSTLSGNSAVGSDAFGGGVYNNRTLTVTGSTLAANSATSPGWVSAGGGIFNPYWSTLTVTGSTLSGNTVAAGQYDGGGIDNDGTLTVSNSTLSGNHAGSEGGGLYVYAGAPVLLHNMLIAGNFRGATGSTRDDVGGALDPSGDYNLIGDGTGMTGLQNGVNGNLVGSSLHATEKRPALRRADHSSATRQKIWKNQYLVAFLSTFARPRSPKAFAMPRPAGQRSPGAIRRAILAPLETVPNQP
jgi:hypothetical protein